MLPNAESIRAVSMAQELVRVLQLPFVLEGQHVAVDASIGIALAPEHGRNAARMTGRRLNARSTRRRPSGATHSPRTERSGPTARRTG
jgi:predicted signal transduction protein with EAL and GGDEF domain